MTDSDGPWTLTARMLPHLLHDAQRLAITPMEADEDPEDYEAAVNALLQREEGMLEFDPDADLNAVYDTDDEEFDETDLEPRDEPWANLWDCGSTAATPAMSELDVELDNSVGEFAIPDILGDVDALRCATGLPELGGLSAGMSGRSELRSDSTEPRMMQFVDRDPVIAVDPHRDKN